jgi:hypothetical protein
MTPMISHPLGNDGKLLFEGFEFCRIWKPFAREGDENYNVKQMSAYTYEGLSWKLVMF